MCARAQEERWVYEQPRKNGVQGVQRCAERCTGGHRAWVDLMGDYRCTQNGTVCLFTQDLPQEDEGKGGYP